jgi:hypothetical protein
MVRIHVGPSRKEFSVHANRLVKTGFFGFHVGENRASPDMAANIPVKQDPDTESHEQLPEDIIQDANAVHYVLAPRDLAAADAFAIFVEWVYKEEPRSIHDRDDVVIFFKAYKYAWDYQAYSLQNQIVDKFREHYCIHSIKFDDLVWMINKFGDDPNATPLTRYIIEQIAFEIAHCGWPEFCRDNKFLRTYIEENTRKIRTGLFALMAKQAHQCRLTDPSASKNMWRVVETGDNAGAWQKDPLAS